MVQSGQPYSVIDYTGAVGSVYYSVYDGITNPVVPVIPGCKAVTGYSGANAYYNPNQTALNPACFTLPLLQPGGLGGAIPANDLYETNFTNDQRNIFRQSWQKRTDLSIVKATQITERVAMRYSFDIFNLTNTASFDVPIDDISQNQYYNQFPVVGTPPASFYNPPASLGAVNKTIGSPRQIQMSLRLTF